MGFMKSCGVGMIALGKLTNQDILFIVSIALTVLGMIQEYLNNREKVLNTTLTS